MYYGYEDIEIEFELFKAMVLLPEPRSSFRTGIYHCNIFAIYIYRWISPLCLYYFRWMDNNNFKGKFKDLRKDINTSQLKGPPWWASNDYRNHYCFLARRRVIKVCRDLPSLPHVCSYHIRTMVHYYHLGFKSITFSAIQEIYWSSKKEIRTFYCNVFTAYFITVMIRI